MFKFKLSIQTLVYMAFFTALEVVLNRFCSINTSGLKIGFSFVPIALCAMCYGPIPAAVCCALGDFLGAMLFPIGQYHPGFTVCAAAMGFIDGVFFYKLYENKDSVIARILPAAVINSVVFGLLLNTLWVSQLYGSKTYIGWFIYRLGEYALKIPMYLIIVPALIPLARRLVKTLRA